MSDHELIPDPKKLQRLMANINRAREIVPDNPAGLKGYILQWILPTLGEMVKVVHTLSGTTGLMFGGLQQISGQVQSLSTQDGILELASFISGLSDAVEEDNPNMDLIRGTVAAMASVMEERFMVNLGGGWNDEDDADDDDGDATEDAAAPPAPTPAPAVNNPPGSTAVGSSTPAPDDGLSL